MRRRGSQPAHIQTPAASEPDEATQSLASTLTPERLVILPFYHDLRNELVKPDRLKFQTDYFWRRWAPLLGPVRAMIVMRMRQYGYYNRRTHELRDECSRTYDEIAASIGISTRTLERYFESDPDPAGGPYRVLKDPLLARFIKLRHQYVWRPEKGAPERTNNEYKIAMDEPLVPEDEALLRLAAAHRLVDDERAVTRQADTRQNVGHVVRGERTEGAEHTGQNGGNDAWRLPDATCDADSMSAQPVIPHMTSEPETTTTSIFISGERATDHPDSLPRTAPVEPESSDNAAGAPEAAVAANARSPEIEEDGAAVGLLAAISAFEAANDRSSTPLERRLLDQLAQSVDAAARSRDDTGVGWVAAAIIEAVESGSRFVAPRRIREICRRWARDGGPGVPPPAATTKPAPAVGGRLTRGRARPAPSAPGGSDPAGGLPAPEVDATASPAQDEPEDDHAPAQQPPSRETPVFVVDPSSGMTNRQLWAAVLEDLRSEYPPGVWATWLRPTSLVGLDGGNLVIGAPSSYARSWLEDHMRDPIALVARRLLGGTRQVRFEVEQEWLAIEIER